MISTGDNGTASSSPLIISLMILSPWSYLYFYPAYEVAVEESNLRYGHLFHIEIISVREPKIYECPETTVEMSNLISKSYYGNSSTGGSILVAMSDMCSEAIVEIAPLFAEWDIPFITIVGTPADLRNRKKYPTIMSTSAADNTVGLTFVKRVLNKFNWTNVFLLCDTNGKSINNYYRTNCRGLRTTLREVAQNRVSDATFDSTSPDGINYALVLNLARQNARVIFVMGENIVMRKIMIYFYTQPYYMYRFFAPPKWEMGDADDLIARDAFRSIFLLLADTDTLESQIQKNATVEMFTRWREPRYQNTDARNQTRMSASMISGYDTIKLLSQVIDSALQRTGRESIPKLLAGRTLKSRLSNRTFGVPTGSLFMDENGIRIPNYILKQLDNTSGTFENVVAFNGAKQDIAMPFGRTLWWRGGAPIANEPRCGYSGDSVACLANGSSTRIIASLLTLTSVVIVSAALFYWYLTRLHQDASWVMLYPGELLPGRQRSFVLKSILTRII